MEEEEFIPPVTCLCSHTHATVGVVFFEPGIGKKRAMAIVRRRPFRSADELWQLFDEPIALGSAKRHLSIGNVTRQ